MRMEAIHLNLDIFSKDKTPGKISIISTFDTHIGSDRIFRSSR